MPGRLVSEAGQKLIDRHPSISVDSLVTSLAKRFEVSTQAMRYRLVTFGVLEPE
jgi:Zn-dependent peptidase ImmA (M78 family)